VLLIRATEARDVLPAALVQSGAQLTVVEAYRNRIPLESVPRLQELFASPADYPDAITFTSASTARNLTALLEVSGLVIPSDIVLASIGPITSQALRDLGLDSTVEAKEATTQELVEALITHFA
jgi:uroporphyrinogen-III synthase